MTVSAELVRTSLAVFGLLGLIGMLFGYFFINKKGLEGPVIGFLLVWITIILLAPLFIAFIAEVI